MKKISLLIASLSLLAFLPLARAADKPELSISLTGIVAKPLTLTPTQLKSDFAKDIKTFKYTAKDGDHSAQGVPLISLVNAAGVQLDTKIKNHQLHFVVVVEGTDGYMATFALTELQPDIGNRQAWLALDTDGKPLAERDLPVSLIVPSDLKSERWVRSIKSIRIVEITPATKPA